MPKIHPPMRLTPEQQELAASEPARRAVYFFTCRFSKSYRYLRDEIESAAFLGACRAAYKYRPELGDFQRFVSFRVCAEIKDMLHMEGPAHLRHTKRIFPVTISALSESDQMRVQYMTFDTNPDPADVVIGGIHFEELIDLLENERSRAITRAYFLTGLPMRAIGKQFGLGITKTEMIIAASIRMIRTRLSDPNPWCLFRHQDSGEAHDRE